MLKKLLLALFSLSSLIPCARADLKAGDEAPFFTLPRHDGKIFSLEERRNVGWTVLYFYPKAETPGCTKQACAFRDAVAAIRQYNAEVFGISSDTAQAQAAFHKNHSLQFPLLADPQAQVISLYGARLPLVGLAKRWTFIIDPELRIRAIDKEVDPALDPERVIETLKSLR